MRSEFKDVSARWTAVSAFAAAVFWVVVFHNALLRQLGFSAFGPGLYAALILSHLLAVRAAVGMIRREFKEPWTLSLAYFASMLPPFSWWLWYLGPFVP